MISTIVLAQDALYPQWANLSIVHDMNDAFVLVQIGIRIDVFLTSHDANQNGKQRIKVNVLPNTYALSLLLLGY